MGVPAKKAPAAAAPKPNPKAGQFVGPIIRKLKRGELLFAEGEKSRSMFFLKTGMIRIFKKKGSSYIEIDTIHSGQIVGELAFLDGNPRSASGEALTNCMLVEISSQTFTQTLSIMPDWLKLLLKTIVGRLRSASTRIRQLEAASTALDYSVDGRRSTNYIFISPVDAMKISTAILLVGSRNAKQAEHGIELKIGALQRYANQVMGIPMAKVTCFLDVLHQTNIAYVKEVGGGTQAYLRDGDFLEQLVGYLNEENLATAGKRHDITLRGFLIMSLLVKHLGKYKVDDITGKATINLAEIIHAETHDEKEPFRLDEFPELVKLGYATNVSIKTTEECYTTIEPESFIKAYRLQRVVKALAAMNEEKSSGGN